MKKTLVALAVMVAAGSANAGIELYNKDGVTVNMKGDVEIRYKKGTADGAQLKQEIDDADFGFDTRYAMDDTTQIGFYYEFSGINSDRATGSAAAGDVYVGFYNDDFGTLKIGKLATQLDDAGIGSDFLFGVNSFFSDADFSGDEAIRYDLDKDAFYFGFGLIQDKHGDKKLGEDGSYLDLKAGYRVADFNFTAFYGQAKFESTAAANAALKGSKTSIAALEARYAGIENVNLELGYYTDTVKPATGSDSTDNTIAFAADYTMNMWTFAGGASLTDHDKNSSNTNADKKVTAWFLNAGYAIAPSTTAYVEVGGDNGLDSASKDTEIGYGVGIKAVF